MKITVDRGGSKGDIRQINVAMWESDGTTEIACERYVTDLDDVTLEVVNTLTPGNTYYISIDNLDSWAQGSFTLCLTDNDISYDYYEGAIELTDLNNWCSSDALYSTIGASPDKVVGSCWNNSGPRFNRWFKFTAMNPQVTITVDVGSGRGTQTGTQLALWESDGTTEVACNRYSGIVWDSEDVTISYGGLTIGNVYYISVDTYDGNHDGSFTLCIDNIDEIYYSRNNGSWNNANTWSIVGYGGAPAADYPKVGDVANIQGYSITITGNESVAELNMNAANATTGLTINNGSLSIQGKAVITNPGNNINATLTVGNNSLLSVNDDLSVNRNGGTATLTLSVDNSTVTINRNFNIYSIAGTNDNTIDILNGAVFTVNEDVLMSNTGGPKTSINVDASSLVVFQDITMTSGADNKNEIALTNNAELHLKADIVRGTPAYGILNCASGTTVYFDSDAYLQTFPSSDGSGTGDVFTYQNVVISNSRITTPQITLDGPVTINESLTLTDGEVLTTSTNLLTLAAGASVSGGSIDSFIDGPMKKVGNTDFEFPVGDDNFWQPIAIANLTGDAATEFTAEYHAVSPPNYGAVNAPLYNVSILEYWDLSNTGTVSNADVTLHWKDQARSDIDDYTDLRIAHFNGSTWDDLGQSSIAASDPGSITVTGVSTFSPFTFGSGSPTSNPLPVELLSFGGEFDGKVVILNWVTMTELNNDFFEIEWSANGKDFEVIGKVYGHGTTSIRQYYSFEDAEPIFGLVYYRLRQVDYDGQYEYSDIIAVDVRFAEHGRLNIYPNPFSAAATITYSVPEKTRVLLTIRSITGRTVYSLIDDVKEAGLHQIMLDRIGNGMFILQFNYGGKMITKKIVNY